MQDIPAEDKVRYAEVKGKGQEPCPFVPRGARCTKKGGVCSLCLYSRNADGIVSMNGNLVTLCPIRFWDSYTVFKVAGQQLLKTDRPILIKEVSFLQAVNHEGTILPDGAGRIDIVLVKMEDGHLLDWCALEMQAVYFSGGNMAVEFQAIAHESDRLVFPIKPRRPDFRSSGPKRLMPQLQTKIPSLRRWGKKTAVIVDKRFFDAIAPMKAVPHLSNADIAWFVVDYHQATNQLQIRETVYTTLEDSVEGLTAGIPIPKPEFEDTISQCLQSNRESMRRKIVRIS